MEQTSDAQFKDFSLLQILRRVYGKLTIFVDNLLMQVF